MAFVLHHGDLGCGGVVVGSQLLFLNLVIFDKTKIEGLIEGEAENPLAIGSEEALEHFILVAVDVAKLLL